MKIFAIVVSIAVLLGYTAEMRVDPTAGLLHPRGGIVMLGVSLMIANVAIWVSTQPHRSLNQRFQLASAGWIWIVVQGGCLAYLHSQASAA